MLENSLNECSIHWILFKHYWKDLFSFIYFPNQQINYLVFKLLLKIINAINQKNNLISFCILDISNFIVKALDYYFSLLIDQSKDEQLLMKTKHKENIEFIKKLSNVFYYKKIMYY